jgi:hypothetical protein
MKQAIERGSEELLNQLDDREAAEARKRAAAWSPPQ